VGALVLFIVAQLGYVVIALALHAIDLRHPTIPGDQMLGLQLLTWLPVTIYLLFITPLVAKTSLRGLGFRAPTARDIAVAVVGAFAMVVLVNGAGTIASEVLHRRDTEAAIALLHQLKTPAERAVFFLLACVFAPFYEELTFRVFVFNAFSRYVPIALAMILSGAFFGVLHSLDSASEILTVGVPLAIGGVVLAYVYASTKCFWANVMTHGLFNAVSVVSILFFHAG
jgi:membrane protease YdiL (CAAX protease family)